jgi:uncharacterized protein YjiS (DUF1127 family)
MEMIMSTISIGTGLQHGASSPVVTAAAAALSVARILARLVAERRARVELEALDDRLLRDIGIERPGIAKALIDARRPL